MTQNNINLTPELTSLLFWCVLRASKYTEIKEYKIQNKTQNIKTIEGSMVYYRSMEVDVLSHRSKSHTYRLFKDLENKGYITINAKKYYSYIVIKNYSSQLSEQLNDFTTQKKPKNDEKIKGLIGTFEQGLNNLKTESLNNLKSKSLNNLKSDSKYCNTVFYKGAKKNPEQPKIEKSEQPKNRKSEQPKTKVSDSYILKNPPNNIKDIFDKNQFSEKTIELLKENSEIVNKMLKTWVNNYKKNKKKPEQPKKDNSTLDGKLHRDILDIYHNWYKERHDNTPPNILVQDAKATKNIISYLKRVVTQKNNNQPIFDTAHLHNEVILSFQYILNNWNVLDDFTQKQLSLTKIHSNITTIISQLKSNYGNAKNKNNDNELSKKQQERRSGDERFLAQFD